MDISKIAKSEQEGVLQTFWSMLQECETVVANSKDRDGVYHEPVLKHLVEQWYLQWNRVTNSTNKPRWDR